MHVSSPQLKYGRLFDVARIIGSVYCTCLPLESLVIGYQLHGIRNSTQLFKLSSKSFLSTSFRSQPRFKVVFRGKRSPRVSTLPGLAKPLRSRSFSASPKSFGMPKYNPEKEIPDLSGKVIIITGGQLRPIFVSFN